MTTHRVLLTGKTWPIETGVTAQVSSPLNQSVEVTYPSSQPPKVNVLLGASSICAAIDVQTCLGVAASALVNLTLPAATGITLTGDRYTLVPDTNVADYM